MWNKRVRFAVFVSLLVMFSSCDLGSLLMGSKNNKEKGITIHTERKELASLGLTVALPDGCSVQDMGTFCLVCESSDVKTAKCFTIERNHLPQNVYKDWEVLAFPDSSKIIYYRTEKSDGSNIYTAVVDMQGQTYCFKTEHTEAQNAEMPVSVWSQIWLFTLEPIANRPL
ncbi:MAG: hypothetical protein SFW35_04740 [Chitinophagales bacterium]|nr:hypothetical protein [Chitinophagales bacterium]